MGKKTRCELVIVSEKIIRLVERHKTNYAAVANYASNSSSIVRQYIPKPMPTNGDANTDTDTDVVVSALTDADLLIGWGVMRRQQQ